MVKICGIIGIVSLEPINNTKGKLFEQMFLNCESRGRDAFGMYGYPKQVLYKQEGMISDYLKKDSLKKYVVGNNVVLGHTRQTTTGTEKENKNNHPFETKDLVLAHNGVIYNHYEKRQKFKTDIETDSVIILKTIQDKFDDEKDIPKAIKGMANEISGSYACWLLYKKTGSVYLFRHNNPIYVAYDENNKMMVFASEEEILKFLEKKAFGIFRKGLTFAKIDEHKIYRLTKKGLMCCGEFEPNYSTSRIVGYDNQYSNPRHSNYYGYNRGSLVEDSDLEEDDDVKEWGLSKLNDYLLERTNLGFGFYKETLEEEGISLTMEDGKRMIFEFCDEAFGFFGKPLAEMGYTISPTNRKIKLSFKESVGLLETFYVLMQNFGMDFGDFSGGGEKYEY